MYNGWDKVSVIKNAVTFETDKGYEVKLSHLASLNTDKENLEAYISPGDEIYLNIINQSININNGKLTLTTIVYFVNTNEKNDTFINLNALLLNSNPRNYYFVPDQSTPDITPYTWQIKLYNTTLANNTQGFDLTTFEDMRMKLAETYNSQTITHAGYFLALLAIVATLLSRMDILLKDCKKIIKPIFSILVGLFFYSFYRLLYWSWLGSQVLVVTPAEALSVNQPSIVYGIQCFLLDFFSNKHWLGWFYQIDKMPFPLNYFLIVSNILLGIIVVYLTSYFINHDNLKNRVLIILIVTIVGILFCLFSIPYLIVLPILFYFVAFFYVIRLANKEKEVRG